jgi:hypothetical protein
MQQASRCIEAHVSPDGLFGIDSMKTCAKDGGGVLAELAKHTDSAHG